MKNTQRSRKGALHVKTSYTPAPPSVIYVDDGNEDVTWHCRLQQIIRTYILSSGSVARKFALFALHRLRILGISLLVCCNEMWEVGRTHPKCKTTMLHCWFTEICNNLHDTVDEASGGPRVIQGVSFKTSNSAVTYRNEIRSRSTPVQHPAVTIQYFRLFRRFFCTKGPMCNLYVCVLSGTSCK
jgi:hypothetical protein